MNYAKHVITCFLFTLFCSTLSYGQYHDNEYLVIFPPELSQDEIEAIRVEFNSTEIWVSAISQTRKWRVDYFPFYYKGLLITNIQEHTDRVVERPEAMGAGLNYANLGINNVATEQSFTSEDDQNDCNGQLSIYLPNNNANQIRIGIFDTGLNFFGNPSDNHYFDLTNYEEYDHIDNDPIAEDGQGHGTHIASIVSHTINKVSASTGTMGLTAMYDIRKTFDDQGFGYLGEIIKSLEEAVVDGIQIANFSWGFEAENSVAMSSPLYFSLKQIEEQYGVLFVAAAGNQGVAVDQKFFPVCYDLDNLISATSFDCMGDLAEFANYGDRSVDIALPGIDITGLDHEAPRLTVKSGTSQSTALLTGIAASLASHQTQFDPQKIICAIMNSAISINTLEGKVKSGGIIDAQAALNILLTGTCTPNTGASNFIGTDNSGDVTHFKVDKFVQIYPNPVQDELTIEYTAESDLKVNFYIQDYLGKTVLQATENLIAGPNKIAVITNNLLGGFYTLQIENGNSIESYKFVKK